MARQSDYITIARQETRKLWDAVNALKALQTEWQALDYGSNLADGVGENEGYTKTEVGSVVFATTDAILTLFAAGHGTNVAGLLSTLFVFGAVINRLSSLAHIAS